MRLLKSVVLVFGIVITTTATNGAHANNLTGVLDILSYNDVYEMVQDTIDGFQLGGPSRVVQIANTMREKNPSSLVLFAGDTASPSLWSTQFKGQQMVKAHNAIKLDCASIGNHDFDYGVDNFILLSEASNFPWLNANCYEIATDKLLRGTVPHVIKHLTNLNDGNISVGIFGVMYDMNDRSRGLYWKDPIQAAREQVAILQAQNVSFIIALTHQLAHADDILSREVPGIGLILGGHDHKLMLQTNYGTPYVKSEMNFRQIWKTNVCFYATNITNGRKTTMTYTAIPITEDLPTDSGLDAVIATYQTQMDDLRKQVIGSLCEELDLRQNVVRTQDCKIGHFFADACLHYYGRNSADIAVMNGGGIRGDKIVAAGNLSLGELLSWSPFGNTLMTIQTNGASLALYLNWQMAGSCDGNSIRQNGFFVHPSGFSYIYTCTGAGTGMVSNMTWLNHSTKVGGITDSEEFVMALSNYLYTSQFSVIDGVNATVRISEAEAERVDSALEAYVTQFDGGNVCLPNEVRLSIIF